MCKTCWSEAGNPSIVNEKTLASANLITDLYNTPEGGCGGGGHIVFDDFNIEDRNIEWCIRYSESANIDSATKTASLNALKAFLELTEDERYSALAIHEKWINS